MNGITPTETADAIALEVLHDGIHQRLHVLGVHAGRELPDNISSMSDDAQLLGWWGWSDGIVELFLDEGELLAVVDDLRHSATVELVLCWLPSSDDLFQAAELVRVHEYWSERDWRRAAA
jgi:hypothetical protein